MQNPDQAPITEQPPNHEQFVRRWQFSLASLMIAMSLVCLLLVDRRTVALFAVIVIVRLGGGKVIRGRGSWWHRGSLSWLVRLGSTFVGLELEAADG